MVQVAPHDATSSEEIGKNTSWTNRMNSFVLAKSYQAVELTIFISQQSARAPATFVHSPALAKRFLTVDEALEFRNGLPDDFGAKRNYTAHEVSEDGTAKDLGR